MRLWSARERPSPFAGETFWANPYSPHPVSEDDYAPYNKPAALHDWLSETCLAAEGVLLLDPDCVFLAPLTAAVERGRPVSHPVSYVNPDWNPGAQLVRRHCRRPSLVQGVGLPTLIHRDDLVVLAPLWLAKTEAIRADPQSRELAGWTAEMWAYMFAAAELGLQHEVRDLCVWPTEDRTDQPILHYCYDSEDPTGDWRWGKRTYRPWEIVPSPPAGVPRASRALVDLLNEWAATRQYCLER